MRRDKVIVVLPAFNAARTLEKTVQEIPHTLVDQIILVDDGSSDETVRIAEMLGLVVASHKRNRGYGGNQKTCYGLALKRDASIVVMLHPDYQYSPRLLPSLIGMLQSGYYDVAIGSRILGNSALKGGMPAYKYYSNRLLTAFQNFVLQQKLSEFHTGLRAYTRRVLEAIPFENNSEDFLFDNQFLLQILFWGFRIGEISCPTKYFPEASSINFARSVQYGLGVIGTTFQMRFAMWGGASELFPASEFSAHETRVE